VEAVVHLAVTPCAGRPVGPMAVPRPGCFI